MKNIVYISREKQSEGAARDSFIVRDMRWIGNSPISQKNIQKNLTVKIRHGEREIPCTISPITEDSLQAILATPEPGVAPGQFAVFYDNEYCLGGGVIGWTS